MCNFDVLIFIFLEIEGKKVVFNIVKFDSGFDYDL